MKILSNTLTEPRWQLVQDMPPAPLTSPMQTLLVDQGHPLSVLPHGVQNQLLRGQYVDLQAIVPVPADGAV